MPPHWAAFFVLAVVGIGLIIFGCALLIKRESMKDGKMKIHIPRIDLTIEISGMRTGIVCIVIGAVLLTLAANLLTSGGAAPSAAAPSPLSMTVLAQAPPPQVVTESATMGWAYLGPKGSSDDWSFVTLVADPTRQVEIMKATHPVTIYVAHYDDLTGSIVGTLLGYEKPPEAGAVNEGACVRATNREVVGFGKVWLEIETLPSCEPAERAIRGALPPDRE